MSLRLLIVEDNQDAADSLAMLLRLKSFEVRVAYGGQQAMLEAAAFRPQVFILDLMMPVLSGFDLAAQLRALPDFKRALFVALSGYSEQTHLDEASRVQFDEYLLKPPNIDLLLKILSEAGERLDA